MVCGHGLWAPRADLRKRVKASLGEVSYWFNPGSEWNTPHGNLMAASAHLQSIFRAGVMLPSPLPDLWLKGIEQ
jgi:hypothetical protein